MPRFICLAAGLLICLGCVGTGNVRPGPAEDHPWSMVAQPAPEEIPLAPPARMDATTQGSAKTHGSAKPQQTIGRTVSFRVQSDVETPPGLPSAGEIVEPELIEDPPAEVLPTLPIPETVEAAMDVLPLNLPTVLSMIGPQHPAVGLAQWRVQQAYAELEQAKALWLPSIRAGFSFNRHDGNLQASDGTIIDVNRNAFQYGLGVGATGAGTTQFPGVVARFHMADAIFQPKIARQTASSRGHAAGAVLNRQLMTAAVEYFQLLRAHQDVRIVEETRDKTADLFKLTSDFAAAGKGLQADADRMGTELALAESRLAVGRERVDVAAARLAEAISADSGVPIVPTEPTVVPIELVSLASDKSTLIRTGLCTRPELMESAALVAAACQQHRRQKYAPFVPSVLLGFSSGGFGGGLGNTLDNTDGRYDFDALVSWEVRNLGMGERAARRGAGAQIQQAKYEKIGVMDQVAREVSQAYAQVSHRAERIEITQRAIQLAEDSYERNLSRIRDGQGLPLEALQSLRALEDVRRAYLDAVTEYNQAQVRLQWSMGWPITPPAG